LARRRGPRRAPRSFGGYGGGSGARGRGDAGGGVELRHGPVHADHQARRRGRRQSLRSGARGRVLSRVGGPRAGGGVPARRRGLPLQRRSRLRAAPHSAPRRASRLAARPARPHARASGTRGVRAGVRRGAGGWVDWKAKGRQQWVGYGTTRTDTDVLACRQAGDTLGLVLEGNPFYAEWGGQVSDTGRVQGGGWDLPVAAVEKVEA